MNAFEQALQAQSGVQYEQGYKAGIASQQETIKALVESLKAAKEKYNLQHHELNFKYVGGLHIGFLNDQVDAALALAGGEGE